MTEASTTSPAAPNVAAQVKEIQDLHATQRDRVIGRAQREAIALGYQDLPPDGIAAMIERSLLELAQCWTDEADWFAQQKRRGWKSTVEEITKAATRLRGFAVGLSVGVATSGTNLPDPDLAMPAEIEIPEPVAHEPQCMCNRPECVALRLDQMDPASICSHPEDKRSRLKSGATICTLCNTTVGPPVTGDATMDYLSGAVNTYEPIPRSANQHLGEDVDVPMNPMNVHISEIGNPFSSPASPTTRHRRDVKRLTYYDLGPLIGATYPAPRAHLSHSTVERYAQCGLSLLLSDASRADALGPMRPSWSRVGGSAFHLAIESIERAALELGGASPTSELGEWQELWESALESAAGAESEKLAGTPYEDRETWHIANGGREGYDWWRVEGLDMVKRYVAFHDDAWRGFHTLLRLPDLTAAPGTYVPVLEWAFDISAGSTAIKDVGFVDQAWTTFEQGQKVATIDIHDLKAGKSKPSTITQLSGYAEAIRRHLPPNFALPIRGTFWLARAGTYTPPVVLDQMDGRAEVDYQYQMTERGIKAGVFPAAPSNLCVSCGAFDYCPTQAPREFA